MSISIIQLDSRAPAGQFATLLKDADLVRFDEGQALPDPGSLTGLIVLGGRQNAYDPGLEPIADLLRGAVAGGVPTLGVCLGGQLLATSHGGRVEVGAPAGPERGIVPIRCRPDAQSDPVLGAVVETFGREFRAVNMHHDAITDLPEGSTWLAASAQYPYQAFRLGSALGVQFHPEADAAIYGAWLHREEGIDPAEGSAQWENHAEELTALASAFARREAFSAV